MRCPYCTNEDESLMSHVFNIMTQKKGYECEVCSKTFWEEDEKKEVHPVKIEQNAETNTGLRINLTFTTRTLETHSVFTGVAEKDIMRILFMAAVDILSLIDASKSVDNCKE